jgi:hypothetical protein
MDHNFEVNVAPATTIDRKKVDIPFRGAEKRMFERYLDSKGLKAGPWLRVKILEAIKYAEATHEPP